MREADDNCGGETPLVKNSELLSKLDPEVVAKFEEKGVRYVRYMPDKSHDDYMNWQHMFGTDDKQVLFFSLLIFFVQGHACPCDTFF